MKHNRKQCQFVDLLNRNFDYYIFQLLPHLRIVRHLEAFDEQKEDFWFPQRWILKERERKAGERTWFSLLVKNVLVLLEAFFRIFSAIFSHFFRIFSAFLVGFTFVSLTEEITNQFLFLSLAKTKNAKTETEKFGNLDRLIIIGHITHVNVLSDNTAVLCVLQQYNLQQ